MAQVFFPNLAQNFPSRLQIGLTYPRSPCGPLSGPTDLARHTPIVAVSDQSGAEVCLPCPDWPYLPSLALWPTFRAHRPRLTHLRLYEALHLSH